MYTLHVSLNTGHFLYTVHVIRVVACVLNVG